MSLDVQLFVGSFLAIAAVLSTRLAQRLGMPTLVLFVGIGMLAGSSGPGGLVFDDYRMSLNFGLVALAVILFSGGLDTEARLFRASLLPAGLLATVGVLLTSLLLGTLAWLLTPLDFLPSLLLGAVLAPTDAAAVFSILKGRGIDRRLRGVLEVESGTNDPVGILLTVALATSITAGTTGIGPLAGGIVLQLLVGAAIGLALGYGMVTMLNRVRVSSFGLYPVLALAGAFLVYSVTNLVGGNGFLAVYLTGLVIGNRPASNQQSIRTFMDSAAWAAQIAMFLLLGLLVFPDRMVAEVSSGLIVTAGLLLFARPLAVTLTLVPLGAVSPHYRFGWREMVLISWAGLKGAVPIILAIVPLLNRVPSAEIIFNIVFVVVIVGTLLQGLTIVPLAKVLELTRPEPPAPPLRLELAGFAPLDSAVVDVSIEETAPAVGRALRDVPLPEEFVIAAIYRGDRLVTPRGSVHFMPGDHVFLITQGPGAKDVPEAFRGGTRTPPSSDTAYSPSVGRRGRRGMDSAPPDAMSLAPSPPIPPGRPQHVDHEGRPTTFHKRIARTGPTELSERKAVAKNTSGRRDVGRWVQLLHRGDPTPRHDPPHGACTGREGVMDGCRMIEAEHP